MKMGPWRSWLLILVLLFSCMSDSTGHYGEYACGVGTCAKDLYNVCIYGLQRDESKCHICACQPAPERECSAMTCHLLCMYSRDNLHWCSNCPCQPRHAVKEMTKTSYYGAAPEYVDAATTGQIDIKTSVIVSRHEGMCFDTTQRWRTADGTCNNVHNFGATFLPVARVLPPVYDDGIQSPRTRSVRGGPLPSAREVSRMLHGVKVDRDLDRDLGGDLDPRDPGALTAMFMQFGQFLDHDITSFPLPTEEDSTIRCCTRDGRIKKKHPYKDCFPIEVKDRTGVFASISCMEFVRSIPAVHQNGSIIYPRENVNGVTSFIDGSVVYGSSEERMRNVRENNGSGSHLKTSRGRFLPLDVRDSCIRRRTSDPCFVAGDDRVNEQPGLTAMHTIFFLEHNRIASTLQGLRPQLRNEHVFQRSRAILGAILQNIVYGQWLPLVLGEVNMHRYGLKTGRRVRYNPEIDPRVTSAFSTSALRFGHSMIPPTFSIGDRVPRLRDLFNKPFEVYDDFHSIVHGLVNGSSHPRQGAQPVDRHFVPEITNHLFQPRDRPHKALDLVALNIQRGRDHGLPPFCQFRRACGLPDVRSFYDDSLGNDGRILESVYSDVNDIDVFTGSMMEVAREGALVGPTTACILARQFHALKYGDRFYFESYQSPNDFSHRQVKELRKASLAWVLCHTLPFSTLQTDVFRVSGPQNTILSCEEIKKNGPDLRILAW